MGLTLTLKRTLRPADQLTGAEEQHFVCREGAREGKEVGGRLLGLCGCSACPSVS